MDNNKFWSKLWLYVPQHRVLWLEKNRVIEKRLVRDAYLGDIKLGIETKSQT